LLRLALALPIAGPAYAQSLHVALAKQPFSPTGTSTGPATMASGGIMDSLVKIGAIVRVDESKLTAAQDTEYGAWKRLGWALGDFARIVAKNERDGFFTVGLYATCPSMPGMVAGLEHSAPNGRPLRIGMLWLDAHPDFNTPETTRSGSMGGMPVAIATGRALNNLRLDATLDPPLRDEDVVMGAVRVSDPLEHDLLVHSKIQQLSVNDIRHMTPAVWAQLSRLNAQVDKLYIHVDMDVLDPREVAMHYYPVPGGPSSEELAALLERIFARYPKASAIGFATIPPSDPGGLAIAALNRMILGTLKGVQARQAAR
jgi:arginase